MLKAENLSYKFSDKFSLKNISLEVMKGEVLGIIGLSGSGKTTLLHLLAGLKEPKTGAVFINGEKVRPPSQKLVPGHEKIKLVTQQNTLFPHISIHENIAYPLRYYEKDYQSQRVDKLAEYLGIKPLLKDKPAELSGGEVQRAMIAQAIADEPLALLLDEPVANLDRINKKRAIKSVLEVVKKEDIACIMVTHDIYDAFGVADKIIIMKDGYIHQSGTPEEIYFSPKSMYVAKMTGEINNINGKLFRPENVEINSKGSYEAEVIESVFQGAYFENTLSSDKQRFIIFSGHRLSQGEIIRFNLKSFFHLN